MEQASHNRLRALRLPDNRSAAGCSVYQVRKDRQDKAKLDNFVHYKAEHHKLRLSTILCDRVIQSP